MVVNRLWLDGYIIDHSRRLSKVTGAKEQRYRGHRVCTETTEKIIAASLLLRRDDVEPELVTALARQTDVDVLGFEVFFQAPDAQFAA